MSVVDEAMRVCGVDGFENKRWLQGHVSTFDN
jgi:hypothetical protein